MAELESGRVQHLDHATFCEAFEIAWIPAQVEWTVTDDFTRRYERLRGRSHRAVGAALAGLVADLARLGAWQTPKARPGLQIRPLPPESARSDGFALSWSEQGRAVYLLEWTGSDSGPIAHVTWLTIGPHGAPDRRRWRGNA
ncbi:MAG: hypothetical protein JWM86_2970 [Thermoleophilia bacterium]|nr:hypothetical protein [Thermoleophilia bacterium]